MNEIDFDEPCLSDEQILGKNKLESLVAKRKPKKDDGKKRIHIVGKGIGWWDAPSEGDVWGVNDLCLKKEYVSLAFELHDVNLLLDTSFREERFVRAYKEQVKIIRKKKIPVIVQKPHKVFPTGIIFPLDEMPRRYFTSSLAYMIAYAIYKKAEAIDIYGVPLYYEEEYVFERPCIEFWLGYASGKGIEITIHKPSYLLTSAPNFGLYAIDVPVWFSNDPNKRISFIRRSS